MGSLGPPRVRRTAQNTQFTYNTSRRIHDIKTYPILSPQGATILIYGHENGVSIVWRGGRRFKPWKKDPPPAPAASSAKDKRNGAPDDASIMIIDSDDEPAPPPKGKTSGSKAGGAAKSAPFVDRPEFEDGVTDEPYPEVVQTLDLPLGSAVLHVAVPPLAPSAAADAPPPALLRERMVIAVSGATSDAYLLTLPLTPPSPASKARPELRSGDLLAGRPGRGDWGETMVSLAGQARYSRGLAVTLVRSSSKTSSSTADRLRDDSGGTTAGAPLARAVVAAHTLEASGTLRFWDVAFDTAPGNPPAGPVEPFQVEYLAAPPSTISFNPTHTSQLLVVTPSHAARIYDFAIPSISPDELSNGPFPSQGSWLLSLYAPFAKSSSLRKPIVDAAWISHGRAILVLLADGMWGIWDVDGARPSMSIGGGGGQTTTTTVLGRGGGGSGIVGAAITGFSCSGFVEGSTSLRGAGTGAAGAAEDNRPRASGEFVPMTPHTRKETQAALSWSAHRPEKLAATRGGIAVLGQPGGAAGLGSVDESVVLWINSADHVCVIPGIVAFWTAHLRRVGGSGGGGGGTINLFSGAQPTRMIKLYDVNTGLLGERCCAVGVLPGDGIKKTTGGGGGTIKEDAAGLGIEMLICGETRFVVLREAEEGPGMKIGGVVGGKRRFTERGSNGRPSDATAIIVHSRRDVTAAADGDGDNDATMNKMTSFNLNTGRYGSVRQSRLPRRLMDQSEDGSGGQDADNAISLPSRPRMVGLGFANTLEAAANDMDDATGRDVELEMLDVLEIDRALDDMEGSSGSGGGSGSGSGRRNVFFEDH